MQPFAHSPRKARPWWKRLRESPALLLVVLNVAIFVLQWVVFPLVGVQGMDISRAMMDWGELSLANLGKGRWWVLITHMFLHGGWMHLMGNALGLYYCGKMLERYLSKRSFFYLYFTAGLVAALIQLAYNQITVADPMTYRMVGASGGVFGLMFAFITLLPRQELFLLLYFILPLKMRARTLGRWLIGGTLVMMLFKLAPQVAHMAHLGGALMGWFYIRYLHRTSREDTLDRVRKIRHRYGRARSDREDYRSPMAEAETTLSGEEEFVARLDAVLDKINENGVESLSDGEREVLVQAREKFIKKS